MTTEQPRLHDRLTPAEAAAILGVSVQTIWSAVRNGRMCAERPAGGRSLLISSEQVEQYRASYLGTRGPSRFAERRRRARALHEQGQTYAQIAAALGITRHQAWYDVRQAETEPSS